MQPFDQILEEIVKAFKLWEVVAEIEHDLSKNESKIRNAIESFDMKFQVHAPIADINLGALAETLREASLSQLFSILSVCQRVGIGIVTIHPGMAIAYGENIKPKVREATAKSLKAIDKKMAEFDVKIALENMPPMDWSIGQDLGELLSMIEGTEIGICFDTGHANVAKTLNSFLSAGYPLVNVHVHNNTGEFDEHLVIDAGTVDMAMVIDELRRFYSGNYIIEARTLNEGIESRDKLKILLGK
ncbi:MAG: sugar phosphate isomerase/epimerase family protein [Thermoplasmata archaeon]